MTAGINSTTPDAQSGSAKRRPVSRLWVLGLATTAIAASLAVWWAIHPAGKPDALRGMPMGAASPLAVPPPLATPTPALTAITEPAGRLPPVVKPAPAPADLGVAIRMAMAEKNEPMRPPPAGQPAWQGMSAAAAARVFEVVVSTGSDAASVISPFHQEPAAPAVPQDR